MPPGAGKEGTERVGECIPRISSCARDKTGANPLEQECPKSETKKDLGGCGHGVVPTKTKAALNQQEGRDRARDQKKIVEITADERGMKMRLQHPAVERI